MTDPAAAPKTCPQCGAVLPSDVTEGLCPRCLMTEAMQPGDSNPEVLASMAPTVFMAEPAASAFRPQTPELPLPEELAALLPKGAFQVEGFLGQGGMGAVYKGTQIRLKRHVAIKIMRRDQGKDHDFERRFEHEAQAMARLNHPNIVSVIDFGEAGPDYLYIVMELVEGADLMDVIRTKRMTQEMALTLLPQICDALQFAHDHGIVHRDIKPSNIMLTRDGQIKMADFGLAKRFDVESNFRTQTGTGMGTPDYAAPEQFIEHSPIDHRADIYALGVMIYQMITGTLPRGVWKPPSHRAEVDPHWDEIVSHAMQSDPEDRYQQASQIKTDVGQITPWPREGSTGSGAEVRLSATRPFRTASTGKAAGKTDAANIKTEAKLPDREAKGRAPVVPAPPRRSRALLYVGAFTALAVSVFLMTRKPAGISVPIVSAPTVPPSPRLPVSASSDPPATTEWVNLFAGLDVKRDSFLNPWRLEGGVLKTPVDGKGIHETIAFPVKDIPANYDLRYRITRNEPGYSIKLFVVQGDGGGLVNFDGIPSRQGDLVIWGAPKLRTIVREKGNWFLLGDTHEVIIQVRESYIAVVFDGQEVHRVEGRCRAEGQYAGDANPPALKKPPFIGISRSGGEFTIHSAELREVKDGNDSTNAAPAAPASIPWEPFYTEAEWKETKAGQRETVDGRLHLTGPGAFKPQPAADGAIRARIQFQQGSRRAGLMARSTADKGRYKLYLTSDRSLDLVYVEPGIAVASAANSHSLGIYILPIPLQPKDTFLLELRLQGDRLTALMDGIAVINAQDSRAPGPGEWGIIAEDGWFESVEVRTAPPVSAPASGAPALPSATKDAPLVNSLGMKFVPVPITGGPTDKQQVLFSIWDTRVQDYVVFATEMNREWPKPDFNQGPTHPAVMVSWEDAQAFCTWLTERERKAGRLTASARYRLPSDHEWSCAVGIGDKEDATLLPGDLKQKIADVFPWGNTWPPPDQTANIASEELRPLLEKAKSLVVDGLAREVIANYHDGYAFTSPVESFAPNPLGLYDMGGNVQQWTKNWNTIDPAHRALRGASWATAQRNFLFSSNRPYAPPASRFSWRGFRVVLEGSVSPSPRLPVSASPAAAGEPWRNLLADPSLELGKDVKRNGQILEFPENNTARTRKAARDGAVRMRAIFSGKPGCALAVRAQDAPGEKYSARVLDAHTVRLYLSHESHARDLQTITLAQPLVEGREYQLELRVVGSFLSVALDGVQIAALQDVTVSEPGKFGAGTYGLGPTAIQSLEFLDLDASPRPPVSASSGATSPAFGSWQPLFTDAEWKETKPGKSEIVDGRVHLLESQNISKPQPGADGAIRASVQLPGGSKSYVAVTARSVRGSGSYKFQIQGGVALLNYHPWGGSGIQLGRKTLAPSLQPGVKLLLELRLQGDRLTALVDGIMVIEAQDSHLAGPGTWGLMGDDGWFESVEVQSPLAAAPPVSTFTPWQPLFNDAEWTKVEPGRREIVDGLVHLTNGPGMMKPQPAADGAIRARIQFREGTKYASLQARRTAEGAEYKLQVEAGAVMLYYFPSGTSGVELRKQALPKRLQPGDTVLLELRLKGDHLTGLVDGAVVIELQDSRLPAPGGWGIIATNGWYESIEVQTPLTAAVTAAPTAATKTADGWEDLLASLTPALVEKTGQGWKLEAGALQCPSGKFVAVPLPGSFAGASYQMRVKLRKLNAAEGNFHFILPVGNRMTGLDVDGRGNIYTGLNSADDQGKEMWGAADGTQIKDTEPHDLEVTVRLEGDNATISITLDTRLVYEWTGPIAALRQTPVWVTTPAGSLAFGTHFSRWTVSEVKVKRRDAEKAGAASGASPEKSKDAAPVKVAP